MADEATPEPMDQSVTGPFHITHAQRGRVLSWLRVVFALVLGVLLVADIAMYSLYQAMRSRVESQEHRIERLDKMITDMLAANENAVKIEAIGTKVDGIDTQVQELTTALKQEAKAAEEAKAAKGAPRKKDGS